MVHTGKHKQAHILSLFIQQHCILMHVLIPTPKQATIFISVVIANGLCLVNCHDNIKKARLAQGKAFNGAVER